MCLLAAVFTLAACSGHEASAEQSIPKAEAHSEKSVKRQIKRAGYVRLGSNERDGETADSDVSQHFRGKQPACAEGRIPAAYEVAS